MKRLILVLHLFIASVLGLSLNERNELQRKFKYYFQTVRPTAPENYVSGQNGSFFQIVTEITILSTSIRSNAVYLDALVLFSWTDDRLILRELTDRVELPEEFSAWTPRAATFPGAHSQSIFLSPTTGTLHWYYRVKDAVSCSFENWKHPFQTFSCEFVVENFGTEVVTVTEFRDSRPKSQARQVAVEQAAYPSANVILYYENEWHASILSIYLPSVMVVALVFFAQWKRRKVQVLVSVAALICLLVMLTSGRLQSGATLLDLWLSGCFLHAAFLLAVDLILPARRVRYSLMLPIERSERAPLNILTKGEGDILTVSVSSESPKKGLRGYISRLTERTLGLSREPSTSSELVSTSDGLPTTQRHVTKSTLGLRKRFALLAISASFVAFAFIYLMLVFTID